MFHDLNVQVDQRFRPDALRTLVRFGYHVVAFNVNVSGLKELTADHAQRNISKHAKTKRPNTTKSIFQADPSHQGNITVLERVTIVIQDPSEVSIFNSSLLDDYDIVAVRPSSEKLLLQCLRSEFDIISLDLDERQHFFVKRPQVHVARFKGIVFEISYACGLRDISSKRYLISNASELVRSCASKDIVISSGAKSENELRAPLDVINLGHVLFKFRDADLANDTLTKTAEDAIVHGDVRARTHKGIVRVKVKEPDENSSSQAMDT